MKQNFFPRVSGKAKSKNTNLTSKNFYKPDGNKTTHNDIGTKTPYLKWMVQQAEKAGLRFNWNRFNKDDKRK